MPKVTYVQPNGETASFMAHGGDTLMEAARERNIAGVIAQCGGACACATCHVYIDEPWSARIAPAGEQERGMLECVAGLKPTSRLACQIELSESLDGLVVHLPVGG